MDNGRVTFLTTASCNGGCRHCSVRPWMEANKGYQMSLIEVASFIFESHISGYKFDEINLAGGEPLLWDNLLAAANLLQNSGIARSVCVVTNGLMIKPVNAGMIERLLRYVTRIRISAYIGNEANISYAQATFPGIQASPQVHRPVTPPDNVPDSLPADCVCRGRGYANGVVTACSPVRTMGYPIKGVSVPIKEGFLSYFDNIDRANQECCQVCVGNKKIYDRIEFTENEV